MVNEQITRLTFEVGTEASKQKLGEYLADNLHSLSKMYLRELIKTGKCEVNGALENSGYRLRPNDFIEVEADLSRGTSMRAEPIALDIVYETAGFVVVNKPAGMLVHPSHRDKSGTLLNALVHHLNNGTGPLVRPGLVHRLDKHTSGLIVVAKTPGVHRTLSAHLMARHFVKGYLALVEGLVASDEGTIDAPIGRHAELKHWSVKEDGKHSLSRFEVVERLSGTTLLYLEPVTGRTNQLRIHCESIGHPIVGDIRRGGRHFSRLCLHACKLGFPHPETGRLIQFESAVDFAGSLPGSSS